MKIVAKAFVDMVKGMRAAKFDDPDEEQWIEQVVVWCLSESSDEERVLLCQAATELAADARAQGCEDAVSFYEQFISRVKSQYH